MSSCVDQTFLRSQLVYSSSASGFVDKKPIWQIFLHRPGVILAEILMMAYISDECDQYYLGI